MAIVSILHCTNDSGIKYIISMFSSAFVELILDRIDLGGIDLARIDFEVKWFMFGSSSKSDSNRK